MKKEIFAINDNGEVLDETFDSYQEAKDFIHSQDDEDAYLMRVVKMTEEEYQLIQSLCYEMHWSSSQKKEFLEKINDKDYFSEEEKDFIVTQYLNSGAIDFLEKDYLNHLYTSVVHGGYASDEDFYEVKLVEYKKWAKKKLENSINELENL
jgi:hypothetical protein